MGEAIAVLGQALRDLLRDEGEQLLRDRVGDRRAHPGQLREDSVGPALEREHAHQGAGAGVLEGDVGVLAVPGREVEGVRAHVLAGDRQRSVGGEESSAQGLEIGGPVGADVEGGLVRLEREGAGAHREHHDLARAAGGFVEELRVRVVAGRGVGELSHVLGVVGAGGVRRRRGHVGVAPLAALEAVQDVRGIRAEVDPEMVHQVYAAGLVDAGEQRLLGVGGALADLGAAGIVRNAADDGRADRARPDHRVGFTAVGGELLLEREQGRPGQADRLTGVVDEVDPVDPQRGEDDDVTVVILVSGAGAAGEPGVRGLGDDDQVVVDAHLQCPPHVHQRARTQHGQHLARPEAVSRGVGRGRARRGEHVPASHDPGEGIDRLGRSVVLRCAHVRLLLRLGCFEHAAVPGVVVGPRPG